jgi:TolC family type I secretion outer membrane protein
MHISLKIKSIFIISGIVLVNIGTANASPYSKYRDQKQYSEKATQDYTRNAQNNQEYENLGYDSVDSQIQRYESRESKKRNRRIQLAANSRNAHRRYAPRKSGSRVTERTNQVAYNHQQFYRSVQKGVRHFNKRRAIHLAHASAPHLHSLDKQKIFESARPPSKSLRGYRFYDRPKTQVARKNRRTFLQKLPHLLRIDFLLKAAIYKKRSARAEVFTALSKYFPKIDIALKQGMERIVNPGTTTNTSFDLHSEGVTATQLVTDFGKTISSYRSAQETFKQVKEEFRQVRQDQLLAGLKAYLNVERDEYVLGNTRHNLKRIREQLRVEQSRVKIGQGTASDLLQVKAQLDGTKAIMVGAEANLQKARNFYYSVFHEWPRNEKGIYLLTVPKGLLPKNLSTAIKLAFQHNHKIKSLAHLVKALRHRIVVAQSSFFPEINLEGKADFERNINGVQGDRHLYMGSLNLNYSLLNGGGDVTRIRSASNDYYAAQATFHQDQLNLAQRVGDQWADYQSSRRRYIALSQQVNRLNKFLRIVKEERKLGRKTMLDILVADSNVISAKSEAISEKAKRAESAFTLLNSMGMLNLHNLLGNRERW